MSGANSGYAERKTGFHLDVGKVKIHTHIPMKAFIISETIFIERMNLYARVDIISEIERYLQKKI